MDEFEDDFEEELEVLSHDGLEQALQNILASALDEPLVITGWTIVAEVVTPEGRKYLLPISKDEQAPWATKGFLSEALDMARSEDTADSVLELIAAAQHTHDDEDEEE